MERGSWVGAALCVSLSPACRLSLPWQLAPAVNTHDSGGRSGTGTPPRTSTLTWAPGAPVDTGGRSVFTEPQGPWQQSPDCQPPRCPPSAARSRGLLGKTCQSPGFARSRGLPDVFSKRTPTQAARTKRKLEGSRSKSWTPPATLDPRPSATSRGLLTQHLRRRKRYVQHHNCCCALPCPVIPAVSALASDCATSIKR